MKRERQRQCFAKNTSRCLKAPSISNLLSRLADWSLPSVFAPLSGDLEARQVIFARAEAGRRGGGELQARDACEGWTSTVLRRLRPCRLLARPGGAWPALGDNALGPVSQACLQTPLQVARLKQQQAASQSLLSATRTTGHRLGRPPVARRGGRFRTNSITNGSPYIVLVRIYRHPGADVRLVFAAPLSFINGIHAKRRKASLRSGDHISHNAFGTHCVSQRASEYNC
eukprot:scaffold304644_cov35-Prasinocladus_malaysianus.AAC.2